MFIIKDSDLPLMEHAFSFHETEGGKKELMEYVSFI